MAFRGASLAVLAGVLSPVHGVRTRRSGAGEASGLDKFAAGVGVDVSNFDPHAKEWMIIFRHGTTHDQIKEVCGGKCEFMGHPCQGGVPFAKIKGADKVRKLLQKRSDVIRVIEPDAEDEAIPTLEEPMLQGMSDGPSAKKLASWGLDVVGVPKRPATGRGVHVYIQDTGTLVSHSDFGGRASPMLDFSSGEMVVCDGTSKCAVDGAGHGTHCAGTIAGRTFGVASEAILHTSKTLRDGGTGERVWNVMGIDYTVVNGEKPAVISLSLGGTGQSEMYNVAIDAATKAQVTVVVAAGNFGSDACTYSPAFAPNAITVGAVGGGNARAAYSNFGTCNNIFAPGTSIVSASNLASGMTAKLTGTSMACPHVAGAAAILLELNPTWYKEDILTHMIDYGKKGAIAKLKPGDPDVLLWVGDEPAPGKPTCPASTQSTEPNYWGDCICKTGSYCSLNGGVAKNCPSAFGTGAYGGTYYKWDCKECTCV